MDRAGKVLAVLVGQPQSLDYAESAREVYRAMSDAASLEKFKPDEKNHRRGDFPVLNLGVTFPLGGRSPTNLNAGGHERAAAELLQNPHVSRMATFASGEFMPQCRHLEISNSAHPAASFALWFPRTYRWCKSRLDRLWERSTHLRRNFKKSIFTAAAFNFGPQVWTRPHRDFKNLPFGMCAIQALGDFDPVKGGHLVLSDLQLVIEFPPGSLILIPSATLTHSNLPVGEGECRASFTQYCGGNLFRYIDNGFRTEKQFAKEDPLGYRQMCALKASRWQEGLDLLSSISEFRVEEAKGSNGHLLA